MAGSNGATAVKTSKAPHEVTVSIPQIDVRSMEVTLVGDSPLITHQWSEKAKKEMLDKQMKKAKAAKKAKDPWQDYCDAMYWITPQPKKRPTQDDIATATLGMRCVAFKAAAVGACRDTDIKMTKARGAFHVDGELTAIEGAPEMREDMVRVGMGTADLRYRPGFNEWRTTLTISYNAAALSQEQIINLFNIAGFGVGVGEWRPEKNGSYGRFHVAVEGE